MYIRLSPELILFGNETEVSNLLGLPNKVNEKLHQNFASKETNAQKLSNLIFALEYHGQNRGFCNDNPNIGD